MDWKREIAVARLVKQKVAEADTRHLWLHGSPAAAAAEDAIASVERTLGFSLDREHRDFLKHADGWESFFQDVDILSASSLIGGPRHACAMGRLENIVDLKAICGFSGRELLPVAVSAVDIDVFAISKSNAHDPGVVIWFAGRVIDKFPSFGEWFLAMIDYNRREYQRMTGQLLSRHVDEPQASRPDSGRPTSGP